MARAVIPPREVVCAAWHYAGVGHWTHVGVARGDGRSRVLRPVALPSATPDRRGERREAPLSVDAATALAESLHGQSVVGTLARAHAHAWARMDWALSAVGRARALERRPNSRGVAGGWPCPGAKNGTGVSCVDAIRRVQMGSVFRGSSCRGSHGVGMPCRSQGVLGQRAVAALVRTAPAWVRERVAAAGWRPLPAAPPLPF